MKFKDIVEHGLDQLVEGLYSLGIGIVATLTGKPGVHFAMDKIQVDAIQVLRKFEAQTLRDVVGKLVKKLVFAI